MASLWCYIQQKSFNLKFQDGSVSVFEQSKVGNRWIKFPGSVLDWAFDSLSSCSSLSEYCFEKQFGFLNWRISTGLNKWGWFLELNVQIRGSSYSIFIPSDSPSHPWSSFIKAFAQLAGANSFHEFGVVGSSNVVCSDSMILPIRDFEYDGVESFLKGDVDEVLILECLNFSSMHHGHDAIPCFPCLSIPLNKGIVVDVRGNSLHFCVDLSSIPNVSSSSPYNCSMGSRVGAGASVSFVNSLVGIADVESPSSSHDSSLRDEVFHNEDISDMIDEANEIKAASIQSGGSNHADSFNLDSWPSKCSVDVVNSLPYYQKSRKKAKSPIAVVSFDEVSSRASDTTMPSRMKTKSKSPLSSSYSSCWSKLPKGVKHHSITKYNDYVSLEPDRDWVIDALELNFNATDDDIFQRMYDFQKIGKIKIAKKVIKILEELSKEKRDNAG